MSSIRKRVLRADRVRRIPRSFSWLDHRLLRDGHLLRLRPREILLYFFLVLVGDHRGLSYYSLRSLSSYLKLPEREIETARTSLCERGLIAYEAPLYQVLSLPESPQKAQRSIRSPGVGGERGGETCGLGEILRKIELLKGDRDG